MSWYHIWCDGAKNHFVHSSLLEGLRQDLNLRFNNGIYKEDLTERVWYDLPGMILAGRSYEKLQLDGVEFEVASQNFRLLYERLCLMKEREFSDGKKYYKVHGWLHCLVLTPEQRDVLLKYMEEELPRVQKTADTENDEFVSSIKKAVMAGANIITSRVPETLPKTKTLPITGDQSDYLN